MTASHRRVAFVCAAVTALFGLAGCSSPVAPPGTGASGSASGTVGTTQVSGAGAHCDYTSTPDQPAPPGHDVGVPPTIEPTTGTVTITMRTTQGVISFLMDRSTAPCTVGSFAYLASKGFFNDTPCHRLTTATSLEVLQCGDPTGTGTGGPGYTIPDENPTNLPAAPDGQGADVYAAGTVAMANTGQPHSGGSQFFLVYKDSELPPTYAVFGRMDSASVATVNKIAAAGVAPGGQSAQDGAPKAKVTINSVGFTPSAG